MNKRIDTTHIGGAPVDQEVLDFMQQSYRGAFGAIASMCGSKRILTGMVVTGGNVTPGWFTYDGKIIPFIGGSLNTMIKVLTAANALVYEDGGIHEFEINEYAQCVSLGGDFNFNELKRIDSLLLLMLDNMKGYTSYCGEEVIGDVLSGDQEMTITIPDQGTSDYHVSPTLKYLSSNYNNDNDVILTMGPQTNTTFKIGLREVIGVPQAQNLAIRFTITKKIA